MFRKKTVKTQIERAPKITRPFYRKVLLLASAILIAGNLSVLAQKQSSEPSALIQSMQSKSNQSRMSATVDFDQNGYAIYNYDNASEETIGKYQYLSQSSKEVLDMVFNLVSERLPPKDDSGLMFFFTKKFQHAIVMLKGAEFFSNPEGYVSNLEEQLKAAVEYAKPRYLRTVDVNGVKVDVYSDAPPVDTLSFILTKLEYYYFKSLRYRTLPEEFDALSRDFSNVSSEDSHSRNSIRPSEGTYTPVEQNPENYSGKHSEYDAQIRAWATKPFNWCKKTHGFYNKTTGKPLVEPYIQAYPDPSSTRFSPQSLQTGIRVGVSITW